MTISDDVHVPGAVASRRSLITLRDVAVHYPVKEGVLQRVTSHVKAVDGVSLTIPRGSTVGLGGESGWEDSARPGHRGLGSPNLR